MEVWVYREYNDESCEETIEVYTMFDDAQKRFQESFVEYNGCEWFEIECEYHADIGDDEFVLPGNDEETKEIVDGYRNVMYGPNDDWEIIYETVEHDGMVVHNEPVGARVPYKSGQAYWKITKAELL